MEKWMQSRPNPYTNNKIGFRGSKSRFGKPAQLFKDSDKDGVANVFDCKPYNKRKQDVIMPFSGSNPMQEMHQRQESTRLNALYQRQVAALQKQLEDEKVKTAAWSSDSFSVPSYSEHGNWADTTRQDPIVLTKPKTSGGSSFVISKTPVMSIPSLPASSKNVTSSPKSSITGGVISAPSKTASSPYAYINVPGGQSRAASPISSPSKSSSSAKGSGGSRK